MKNLNKLLKELKAFYKKEGREHLPWRQFDRPLPAGRQAYNILVSEIMLQQTQAGRVVPFYNNFIKQFPTSAALAKAPLSKVLAAWQGLGYNRRAKFLHEAAKVLSSGTKKFSLEFLESLPGVGPYTARAVLAFAYNSPEVFIETNIRTVFFHYNILQHVEIDSKIDDKELLPLVAEALKKSHMEPRNFYAALMDYGSYLKANGVRTNNKSKHYTKQSKFEGSARQLRGAIIKQLLRGPTTNAACAKIAGRSLKEVNQELAKLQKEGLVQKKGKTFLIAK